MAEHGDELGAMIHRLGLPEADWLDLSTGINPYPWQPPTPPPAVWQHLPARDDGLLEAAAGYYGTGSVLPVPGTQAAMSQLPRLRKRARVGVIAPGYNEHGAVWSRAGHDVVPLSAMQMGGGAGTAFDVLVVVNPNNPDGAYFDPATLLEWRNGIASRGGWMIVDEAFVDPTPEYSLAPYSPLPGLIVLRSMGPFFGLAGMRLGFALGPERLLAALDEALGPWAVNGPARWVGRQALADTAWQARTRAALAREAERLGELLARHFRQRIVGTPLFRTVLTPHAAAIQEALAHEAILVRLLDRQDGLRFGLPPDPGSFERVSAALARCAAQPTDA